MYATRTGLPPPEPTELEELAVEILQRMFNAPLPAQRVGRAGQKQFGIDVKVRAEDGRYIGAQTKRYLTTLLTPKKLMREVEASAVRIPVHAGPRFRSMPGRCSGACRATIPAHAGRVSEAG